MEDIHCQKKGLGLIRGSWGTTEVGDQQDWGYSTGKAFWRLKGQELKAARAVSSGEGEEEMDGKTFKKKHNLTTGTKMFNKHKI